MPDKTSINQTNSKLNFSLDLRLIIIILLLVIAGMIAACQPWSEKSSGSERTVSVKGETKLKAEPDEFVFYPRYDFKNADKNTALAELTKKSEEITAQLKALGIPDNKIKSDSNGNNYNFYYDNRANQNNYSLSLRIIADNKETAQKVQDYLITTTPLDSVSPQPGFSDAKRKELENKARDDAIKDAQAKAEQSARNLGFKVGKVKSVEDGTSFGEVMPFVRGGAAPMIAEDIASSKQSLSVQPGENELPYSVTVVYYLR